MINNVILVGTISNEIKLKKVGDYDVCDVVLRVQRPFRDMETNEYKSDFIPITFWNVYADNINTYCKKGDIIGVKARLARKSSSVNGTVVYTTDVIGERVVFIHLKSYFPQFKNLTDKSELSAEDYVEPTLEDLKKISSSLNKEELDANYMNQTNDYYDEDEMDEDSEEPKTKNRKKK